MVDPRKAKIVKRNESNGSSTEVDCAVSVRGVLAKNYICLELWWCLIMMNKTVWYHCQHWQTAALKPVSSSLVPLLPSCYFPWVAWGVLWVLTRLFYSVAPPLSGYGKCSCPYSTRWRISVSHKTGKVLAAPETNSPLLSLPLCFPHLANLQIQSVLPHIESLLGCCDHVCLCHGNKQRFYTGGELRKSITASSSRVQTNCF